MSWGGLASFWMDSMSLSVLLWVVLGLGSMYMARPQAHAFLLLSSRAIRRWLLAASRLLETLGQWIRKRQGLTHAALARDQAQRSISRLLHSYASQIERDLGLFPQLQRRLSDQLTLMERDYHRSAETPPEPPQWLDAVTAVAEIKTSGDTRVAEILDGMHATLTRASHDAIDEYRFSSRQRHGLLRRLLPQWKKMTRLLRRMDANIGALLKRAESLDAAIARFEHLRVRPITVRMTNEVFYGLRFVFSIAALSALAFLMLTQHHVLTFALKGLLAGTSSIFAPDLGSMAAWVIIAAELIGGILFLEINQVTRLFLRTGEPTARARLYLNISLIMLWMGIVVYAATLGVMGSWVENRPGIALVTGGEIILLALLQLPAGILMESALRNGQSALLSLVSILVGGVALFLRLFAGVAKPFGIMTVAFYDLLIFLPLWLAPRVARIFQPASDGK